MNKFAFINKTFLKKGLKIFPVQENAKLPLIDAWHIDCSCDLSQVLYWLENAKNCNIGLPANENDLFIVDVDNHDINGLESFKNLCNDLGIDSNVDTLSQKTPSGGIHYIFKSDDELKKVMNSSNSFKEYPGIDIRTKGYILVEPSIINGNEYKLSTNEIKTMPDKLKKFIIENNQDMEIKHKDYVRPDKIERGNRDSSVFEYLHYLYYKTRLNREEIRVLAHYFNQNTCVPPLSDGVIEYKVKQLFKKERNKIIICNIGNKEEE